MDQVYAGIKGVNLKQVTYCILAVIKTKWKLRSSSEVILFDTPINLSLSHIYTHVFYNFYVSYVFAGLKRRMNSRHGAGLYCTDIHVSSITHYITRRENVKKNWHPHFSSTSITFRLLPQNDVGCTCKIPYFSRVDNT